MRQEVKDMLVNIERRAKERRKSLSLSKEEEWANKEIPWINNWRFRKCKYAIARMLYHSMARGESE